MSSEYQKFISKEDINLLPMYEFAGKVEVIVDHGHALIAIHKLAQESLLGFDTETKPVFVKGQTNKVALLQLAAPDCVYLFRMNRLPQMKELAHLLENPNIIKAGVAIQDDLKGLQKILPMQPKGFVDLSKEAEKRGFESVGLRPLTAIFLGLRLSKKAKITNWERHDLTEQQVAYAACDAEVGRIIYQKMMV